MKLSVCISAAILLVLSNTPIDTEAKGLFKIPIEKAHPVVDSTAHSSSKAQGQKSSTFGRWTYALRKYGFSIESTGFYHPKNRGAGHGRGRSEGPGGKGRLVNLEGSKLGSNVRAAQVPLVNHDFDREYFGLVQVGEPPRTFKIDFDTGSSRFVLSSKGCVECSGTTRFDPGASKTFEFIYDDPAIASIQGARPVGSPVSNNGTASYPTTPQQQQSSRQRPLQPKEWHITYGDFTHAEGYLGNDQVIIGGGSGSDETSATQTDSSTGHSGDGEKTGSGNGVGGGDPSSGRLIVQRQQLALVTSESANFDDTIDGIMGLAFGALSSPASSSTLTRPGGNGSKGKSNVPFKSQTVFESMMEQGLVDRGIFSVYLTKQPRGPQGVYLNKPSLESDMAKGDDTNAKDGRTVIDSAGGEVIFGGMDLSRIEDGHELTYTPVTKPKYWQINVENILVNGQLVSLSNSASHSSAWAMSLASDVTAVKHAFHKTKSTGLGREDRTREHRRIRHRNRLLQLQQQQQRQEERPLNFAAIMDTGTTLMIMPQRLAAAVHALIPGARRSSYAWIVPCDLGDMKSSSPWLDLEIEGKRFSIPFQDLVREPAFRVWWDRATSPDEDRRQEVNDQEDHARYEISEEELGSLSEQQQRSAHDHSSPTRLYKAQPHRNKGLAGRMEEEGAGEGEPRMCFSGIQSGGSNFMIIGDVFIKNNYVVFDQENRRIGIAPLKGVKPGNAQQTPVLPDEIESKEKNSSGNNGKVENKRVSKVEETTETSSSGQILGMNAPINMIKVQQPSSQRTPEMTTGWELPDGPTQDMPTELGA
ncbi:hypothetical protein BGW38_000294 [Lunasporangiospora selenospora]|uniref:Peptidase A1 domain-containing protein n=1 Tax=Lunasporangiospora selenospora TaxID=979761 RepID=A0A9P6FVA2_9FUNG|nr:hypothetical protein BGW38_000294 [Lunasporangiospora selenospora]